MTRTIDLALSILKTDTDTYAVTAEEETRGRAGPEKFTWSDIIAAESSDILRQLKDELYALRKEDFRHLGSTLFDVLLRGQVYQLFSGLFDYQVQPQPDTLLRLRIDIDERAPEVAALPWELLHWRDVYLGTQVQTLLTRHLSSLEYGARKPLTISGRPEVLIVIPGGSGLDTEREEKTITVALSATSIPFRVLKDRVSLRGLDEALGTATCHILHYIGHGALTKQVDGTLVSLLRFNDGGGDREEWVTEAQMQALLGNHRDLRLMVLNACQGATVVGRGEIAPGHGLMGMAPSILRAGVPAVVAMQSMIPDALASTFAEMFYRRLTSGKWAGQVDVALTLARNACFLAYPDDFGFAAPVLYLRSTNGRIFELPQEVQERRPPARIFISYKRHANPDEVLARELFEGLGRAGHQVFIDQTMRIGVQWAAEIKNQIIASDYFVVLLSQASADSEMVAREVQDASDNHRRTGKSSILPIRVNYTGVLPYQLSYYLDQLQQAAWSGSADTGPLIEKLLEVIERAEVLTSSGPLRPQDVVPVVAAAPAPKPFADPRFVDTLREPSGAVRLQSEFYIERKGDDLLRRELNKPYGTTTTIRAPRQTGKSSLLIRGVTQAKNQGSRVVLIDLQPVTEEALVDLDSFLRYFATVLVSKLRLDPAEVDKSWRSPLGASDKITYFMEDYLLPQVKQNIVLAIDEADRLLQRPYHDTFFGLLRFWHNHRAMNELWENLDLVMVISTEPHLLISDVTQSPFNVGLKIHLEDFDEAQVRELNRRHHYPLEEGQVASLVEFLDGHPYLTRKALYTLLTEGISWAKLAQIAATEASPFGDHLRRYLWLLRDQPELRKALKLILAKGNCQDETTFYRLYRAGLIKGTGCQACRMRCKLYEIYLADKLS